MLRSIFASCTPLVGGCASTGEAASITINATLWPSIDRMGVSQKGRPPLFQPVLFFTRKYVGSYGFNRSLEASPSRRLIVIDHFGGVAETDQELVEHRQIAIGDALCERRLDP